MVFDPNPHMIRVNGGKMYLPVAARLVWFRMEHPNWGITTDLHTLDMEKQYAVFRATITDETGNIIAQATKMENVRGFGDYLEKAETGSVGRALAYCGYGTMNAPELDEGEDRLADAPKGRNGGGNVYQSNPRGGTSNGAAATGNQCEIEGCGNVLTAGQATTSHHKFGRILCLTHQKEAANV